MDAKVFWQLWTWVVQAFFTTCNSWAPLVLKSLEKFLPNFWRLIKLTLLGPRWINQEVAFYMNCYSLPFMYGVSLIKNMPLTDLKLQHALSLFHGNHKYMWWYNAALRGTSDYRIESLQVYSTRIQIHAVKFWMRYIHILEAITGLWH